MPSWRSEVQIHLCQRASTFCFWCKCTETTQNRKRLSCFVKPPFAGICEMMNLWNDSESKRVFFFLIAEKTGAAASYSQPMSLSVVRSDLWEEAFRCCVTVSLLMPTLSLKVRNVQIRGKMLFILFFFCAVSYCNNKPPPLRSGDEATSLPRSLDRLRNTIRWQTICFVREREIRQKKKMKECKKYKPSCSTSPPI